MSRNERRKAGEIKRGEAYSRFADDGSELRFEKGKARELRASRWWKNLVAKGVCHYCGNKVLPEEITMDHVVPLALGGKSEKTNIVACCKDCNTKKKDSLAFEWQNESKSEE